MTRARNFYEKTLGLETKGFAADGNYLFACGGDAQIALIPKPEGTKAEHTALSFEVSGIEKVIADLEGRGVVFEDYDFPIEDGQPRVRARVGQGGLVQGHRRQLPVCARGRSSWLSARSVRNRAWRSIESSSGASLSARSDRLAGVIFSTSMKRLMAAKRSIGEIGRPGICIQERLERPPSP